MIINNKPVKGVTWVKGVAKTEGTVLRKGVTLVELLIAVSMLLVIFLLAFSLYFFGARSFNNGLSRSNVQQNINLAAEAILDEMRYAAQISIIDTPADFETGLRYIFINEGNQIEFQNENETKVIPDILTEGITYSLLFESKSAGGEDGRMLRFSVSAEGLQEYSIQTDVAPLNLESAIEGTGNIAVSYKPPEDG